MFPQARSATALLSNWPELNGRRHGGQRLQPARIQQELAIARLASPIAKQTAPLAPKRFAMYTTVVVGGRYAPEAIHARLRRARICASLASISGGRNGTAQRHLGRYCFVNSQT